ncbi:hypothetical protein [Pseudozobellia thermophila]|nr:hypothetical protein [Pseudozobellia thermophila]
MSPTHHDTQSVDFELEVGVLHVREVQGETNSIKVEYEVMNRGGDIFLPSAQTHNVFFMVKTQEGREIGHYERIYRKIAPNSSIILEETINLSVYNYASIEASIFVE